MYENKSNPLIGFMNEKYVTDPNGHVFQFEFKQQFEAWCLQNGHRPRLSSEVNEYMNGRYNESKRQYPNTDKSYRVWLGVRQKSQDFADLSQISQISPVTPTKIPIEKLVQSSGEIGEIGEESKIFHKCHICGDVPCVFFDNYGKPYCDVCQVKAKEEKI
jgi:hypothetical protein